MEYLWRKVWKQVKRLPNVNSISQKLQPRIKNGKVVPESCCVRVYVSHKVSKEMLKPNQLVALSYQGFSTDVMEIGDITALSVDGRKKFRPAPAGISIGHKDVTAGTLGWFVSLKDGRIAILSNNHILANENDGKIGDAILQPSKADGGVEADMLAKLYRFAELKYTEFTCPIRQAFLWLFLALTSRENLIDGAIALPLKQEDVKLNIIGIGKVLGKRLPIVGDKTQKSGRTTGRTQNGIVIDTSWAGNISYRRGIVFFVEQILIEGKGFSAPGDSGSLILDNDKNAIGLLFAGSSTNTIANKISSVEEVLGCEIFIEGEVE